MAGSINLRLGSWQSWRVLVLAWIAAGAGCRSEATIQERSFPAMAGAMEGFKIRAQAPSSPTESAIIPAVLGIPLAIAPVNQNKDAGAQPRRQDVGESTPPLPQVPDLYTGATRDQTISLGDALRLAGVDNPTIGLAEELVRANTAELMLARSLLFPSFNVGTTLSMHQGNLLSSQGIIRNVERESLFFGAGADVRGAGPVAVPGIILTSHLGDAVFAPQVARQKVLSSSFDALATRNQILLQVSNAYLGLAGAEARVLVLRQSEGELAEVARLTSNFALKGQGREGDAQRARGTLELLHGAQLQAEEGVAVQAADLARLLSSDPAMRLRSEQGTPPLVDLVDMSVPLENLIQQALARHPEIAARSAEVALYETRLRQERVRPLVPTLAVGLSAGDFGGGSDQVGYRFSHFGGRADVDVLAFWTVQNLGFGNLAVQNKVRAEIGQATAQRARTIDRVRREVAQALAQATSQRQQMDIAKKRAASAQLAFREDLIRARNLQGLLIEVLDSFNLLTTARQELVSSMVAYSQAQFELYVALGNTPASSG